MIFIYHKLDIICENIIISIFDLIPCETCFERVAIRTTLHYDLLFSTYFIFPSSTEILA